MKYISTYYIRFGILMALIGSIILSISIIYFLSAIYGWKEENFEAQIFLLRALGAVGFILLLGGIALYLKALHDGYFIPLKQLMDIHSHPLMAHEHPFNPQSGIVTCKICKKQIPFDSNLCPYCGIGQ